MVFVRLFIVITVYALSCASVFQQDILNRPNASLLSRLIQNVPFISADVSQIVKSVSMSYKIVSLDNVKHLYKQVRPSKYAIHSRCFSRCQRLEKWWHGLTILAILMLWFLRDTIESLIYRGNNSSNFEHNGYQDTATFAFTWEEDWPVGAYISFFSFFFFVVVESFQFVLPIVPPCWLMKLSLPRWWNASSAVPAFGPPAKTLRIWHRLRIKLYDKTADFPAFTICIV